MLVTRGRLIGHEVVPARCSEDSCASLNQAFSRKLLFLFAQFSKLAEWLDTDEGIRILAWTSNLQSLAQPRSDKFLCQSLQLITSKPIHAPFLDVQPPGAAG
jgi:hypothetical protein